jgi:hypothetical protein
VQRLPLMLNLKPSLSRPLIDGAVFVAGGCRWP